METGDPSVSNNKFIGMAFFPFPSFLPSCMCDVDVPVGLHKR